MCVCVLNNDIKRFSTHQFCLCFCLFSQLVQSLITQKKSQFRSWFQFLLLLCLLAFVLCYALTSSSVSLWQSLALQKHYQLFLNKTSKFKAPPYRIHPKHRAVLNDIHQTTQPPTVRPIQYHPAHPHNYQFIMDYTEICKNKIPFLVLMVPVAPDNVEARDAIRQTWANESMVQGEVVLTLFVLGVSGKSDAEKLKHENLQHHDLIQSNFIDSYHNLTIKTMVIMDWLATHCRTAAYAMKIDSDMFLNIDNLVTMLKQPGIPKTNYLTGMLMWNRPVIRFNNSKWYVPEEMFPEPNYPTYTLGMGYVFSNDLPEKFVEISKSVKPFNIEDAYIGMCMKKLGLAPKSPPKPSQFMAYNTGYNRCAFSQAITYILGSSKQLVEYWTDLKKPGPPCP